MLKDKLVVLTEEEYEAMEFEALEARKPQVDAEVIARTQGALIGWQNADEFDADELQEHGDVLRDATRALLAAVEAAPEPAPEPAPDFSAMDPDNLSLEEVQALRDWLDERGRRKVREEFRDGGGVAWRGELWVRDKPGHLLAQVHLQRTEPAALLALCQKIAAEEASSADPTPDFASMSADELRAWLDERGLRSVWRLPDGLWCAALNALTYTTIAEVRGLSDEPAALLALCQKVAAKEAS